jgi:hypothetical protein
MVKVKIAHPLNTKLYGVYLYEGIYTQATSQVKEKFAVLKEIPSSIGEYDAKLYDVGDIAYIVDNQRNVTIKFEPKSTGLLRDNGNISINPIYTFTVEGLVIKPVIEPESEEQKKLQLLSQYREVL